MENNNNQNTDQTIQGVSTTSPSPEQNTPVPNQPVGAQQVPSQPSQTPVQQAQPQTPQQQPAQPVQQTQESMPPPPKKKKGIPKFAFIGIFIVLVIIVVMMILSSLLPGVVPNPTDIIQNGQETPTPSATASSTPVATSPYADDPEILEIEQDIIDYDRELNNASLREDTLRIPTLEWEVEF